MKGTKRHRADHDHEKRIAPQDFNFTFNPNSQYSMKLSTTSQSNTKPVNYSIKTLTRRFQTRLQEFNNTSIVKTETLSQQQPLTSVNEYNSMLYRHYYYTYTLVNYLQLALNTVSTGILLYIIISALLILKHDFNLKTLEHITTLSQDKIECTRNFYVNHCDAEKRVPAIEVLCQKWLSCIEKDLDVSQGKASAESIAEIMNGLIEPITYKTMFFFTMVIGGTVLFSNLGLSELKRKMKEKTLMLENK